MDLGGRLAWAPEYLCKFSTGVTKVFQSTSSRPGEKGELFRLGGRGSRRVGTVKLKPSYCLAGIL